MGRMQCLCQSHIPVHILLQFLRVVTHGMAQCIRAEHLKHDAQAVPHLYRIICDHRWYPVDEGRPGKTPLPVNGVLLHPGLIYLDDLVLIQAIDRSVAALSELLTAVYADLAQLFADSEQLRKSGGLKDLIDFRRYIPHLECIGGHLPDLHQHPESCAGDVPEISHIKYDLLTLMLCKDLLKLLLRLRRIVCVDPAFQSNQ